MDLEREGIGSSRLSLRWLVSDVQKQAFELIVDCLQVFPIPLEPQDTNHEGLEESARKNGWVMTPYKNAVPSSRYDPDNVHVHLHIDPGEYASLTVVITLIMRSTLSPNDSIA
jgi:hypothetical protein